MDIKVLENLQARTDSKLRYAEIHLNELKEIHPNCGSDFDRAHQESFLFHLIGARDSFLLELNAYYGLDLLDNNVKVHTMFAKIGKLKKTVPEFDELYILQKDGSSWLFHALEMRNHSTHISHIARSYHLGGVNHQKVWLKIPTNEHIIEIHFVDLFSDWLIKMRALLERLRNSSIKRNS